MRKEFLASRARGHRSGRWFALAFFFALSLSTNGQVSPENPDTLSPDLESRLRQQILNGSTELKRSALLEIRNLESAAASRIALPALSDKDPVVRATAAGSIIFLPKNEGSAALLPLLDDKDEFVRREAAYALGEVRDTAATPGLVRRLRTDKIIEVRTAAAIALGKIGDPAAFPSLLSVLDRRPSEDEEFLRRSAARSMGQIAQIQLGVDPNVLTPQNFLPEKFKELGPAGPQSAQSFPVETLLRVLEDSQESDDTRREAAFALGAIGDRRSIPFLQKYLTAADPYLAEICKEALLKIERRNKTIPPTD